MNAPTKIKDAAASPIETFATAFVKLQSDIKPAIKDATNPAFRSKYADLGAVWEAIKEPLSRHGFSVIQSPDFDGETMWLRTTVLHISGERMEGRYPIRPTKPDPQGVGSAITYARRYSISAMLGVVADEDDDGNAASARPAPAKPAASHQQDQTFEQDPDGQVKAWVEQQKGFITECQATEFLKGWKKRNDAAMGRLETRNPVLWNAVMDHYQAKYEELYTKEKQ